MRRITKKNLQVYLKVYSIFIPHTDTHLDENTQLTKKTLFHSTTTVNLLPQ